MIISFTYTKPKTGWRNSIQIKTKKKTAEMADGV